MNAPQQDPRPRHQQVTAELRAAIMSGELAPGTALPSVGELATRYGTAWTTIQHAQATLRAEGLITSRAGKAVWVRDDAGLVPAKVFLTPSDRGWSYDLLTVTELRPPAPVAQALRLADPDTAILRQNLMRYDGEPVELSWSYFPAALVKQTPVAQRRKIRGGAPAALAALGLPPRHRVDQITARQATTEELQALHLGGDSPVVLRTFRTIRTNDNQPIEADILIKGAHHTLVYDQAL